jgi:Lipocalin-like domain
MTKLLCCVSALLVLALSLSFPDAYAGATSQSLIGTWKLISMKQVKTDGSSSDLYGVSPSGQLIYESKGHMSVQFQSANLPKCGTLDRRKCSDSAARSAFDNYLGYWGRYTLSADGKSIMHVVEGSSAPDWVGTTQQRFFELAGDRLTLTTPLQQIAGVESKTVLVWQREK